MKAFKKPDIKGPRYRPTVTCILNHDLFKRFLEKYPEYKHHKIETFKEIINTFNEELWKSAIEYRDGIELPESLGNIFIGTCWKAKRKNINMSKSIKYNQTITNQNYETDGKLGKIFYTNYNNKYRFRNRVMWMFTGHRNFKRSVAEVYPVEWKKYIAVDPNLRINKLYKRKMAADYMQMQTKRMLEYYDEFDMN